MSAGNIKDATRQLQAHFSAAKLPLALPPECRRILQSFVDEHSASFTRDDSIQANAELKLFWERYVHENPKKLPAFAGVLKELRPIIIIPAHVTDWYVRVARPVLKAAGSRKQAVEDVQDFLVEALSDEGSEEDGEERTRMRADIINDLVASYLRRSRGPSRLDPVGMPEGTQIVSQIEGALLAMGRRQPTELLVAISDAMLATDTRLSALTLLGSFIRTQVPRLYLAGQTSLVDHLVTCLMNDTSTTILSVALTSLIMLLPHIPASMTLHLPRFFLVYSRLLCWERYSPLSTPAERNLAIDSRISYDSDDDQQSEHIGFDPNWKRAEPPDGSAEPATPDVMTYFTFLYGLFPLNLMSYIRKPRRYLKDAKFPNLDGFDLERAVIRSRSHRFCQLHLLHPNFHTLTIEDELTEPKWAELDPADVVAECHTLRVSNFGPAPNSAGIPPMGKAPDLLIPPTNLTTGSSIAAAALKERISPAPSHSSLRNVANWHDTASTAVATPGREHGSPVVQARAVPSTGDASPDSLRPLSKMSATSARAVPSFDDISQSGFLIGPAGVNKDSESASATVALLQQDLAVLRNDLNFERWHKAQYSQHIGQMMRKNVKEATSEAETLNLINQIQSLRAQLDQSRKAREATIKDSALTRKQANNLEVNLVERFNKMKLEQEAWTADADELRRIRGETKQYRELLVASEAREVEKAHQLEIIKRDLEQMAKVQSRLHEAQRQLRDYEYREFEFSQAKRLNGSLKAENTDPEAWAERRNQNPVGTVQFTQPAIPITAGTSTVQRSTPSFQSRQTRAIVHSRAGLIWQPMSKASATSPTSASTLGAPESHGDSIGAAEAFKNLTRSETGAHASTSIPADMQKTGRDSQAPVSASGAKRNDKPRPKDSGSKGDKTYKPSTFGKFRGLA